MTTICVLDPDTFNRFGEALGLLGRDMPKNYVEQAPISRALSINCPESPKRDRLSYAQAVDIWREKFGIRGAFSGQVLSRLRLQPGSVTYGDKSVENRIFRKPQELGPPSDVVLRIPVIHSAIVTEDSEDSSNGQEGRKTASD